MTKRLVVVEVLLGALLVSRLLLGSFGMRLNAERIGRSLKKLEEIPDVIAGWEWDRTVSDESANVSKITGGGYSLFVRSYVRPKTGERVCFQVCRWLDPLSCYELHGWRIVKTERRLLIGQGGRKLRAAGVREGWVERDGERMGVLFWESDLVEPRSVLRGALTEDAGARGRLSRLLGRTERRIRSFFQKSAIVVKVICAEDLQSEEGRLAVVQFAREISEILPNVLK